MAERSASGWLLHCARSTTTTKTMISSLVVCDLSMQYSSRTPLLACSFAVEIAISQQQSRRRGFVGRILRSTTTNEYAPASDHTLHSSLRHRPSPTWLLNPRSRRQPPRVARTISSWTWQSLAWIQTPPMKGISNQTRHQTRAPPLRAAVVRQHHPSPACPGASPAGPNLTPTTRLYLNGAIRAHAKCTPNAPRQPSRIGGARDSIALATPCLAC